MRQSVTLGLASLMIVLGMTSHALAGFVVAPEIDGSTVSAGLGLLAAGVLIVRSRRGSK